MVRSSKTARAPRPPVHWLELALPLYALAIVVLYYRPNSVDLVMADEQLEDIVLWPVWILGGVFGVMLALSGLFLAFCLLYSPIYLARNVPRALNPGLWIDPSEVRFYFFCFGLLCLLVVLAVWKFELALVVFVLLAGSVKLLVRLFG